MNTFDNRIGLRISSRDCFYFQAIIVFDHFGEFYHESSTSVEGDSLRKWDRYLVNHVFSHMSATSAAALFSICCISNQPVACWVDHG